MSTLLSPGGPLLPTTSEVAGGLRDTTMLLRLRWRSVRNTRARVVIAIGFALICFLLFVAAQAGNMVRRAAEQGTESALGEFAVNYVIALSKGELGAVGAAAIGSVFVVSLMTPFVGAAMQALAPADDLTGLRPTRLHRYFDSLILSGVSAVGFFQLITLTALGSLLTLDGGRAGGLLFMWAIWPLVLLLGAGEGWLIELVHRRFGTRVRTGIGLTLAALVALAVWLDPRHGSTLFGVGNTMVETVRTAAGGTGSIAPGIAVLVGIAVALFMIGLVACRAALALPASIASQRTTRRMRFPLSTRPNVALTQIVLAQVLRTGEVKRPLRTILLVGIPAVWLVGNSDVMTTLVVAVPLSVALAFGTNIFGILGSALPWLASQPKVMGKLFVAVSLVQVAMMLLISALLWAPPALFGRIDLADVAAVAAGTVVSSFLTARSAAAKSVNRPFLVRLGNRGDMIVPPLTAINYTFRFALWSGQVGVLVMGRDGWLQAGMVAAAVTWSLLRFVRLARDWRNREVQSFVIRQVAAA